MHSLQIAFAHVDDAITRAGFQVHEKSEASDGYRIKFFRGCSLSLTQIEDGAVQLQLNADCLNTLAFVQEEFDGVWGCVAGSIKELNEVIMGAG